VRVRLLKQPVQAEGNAPGQTVRGTVLAVAPDTLVIRVHPSVAPFAIAEAGIDRIEVSRGVRTRLEGAVRSGIFGALLGGSEWAALNSMARQRTFEHDWQAITAGAACGAVLGAIVGAITPLERWKKVRWR
jgi:hypothetical protein